MINHNFKSKEKALAQPETAQGTNIRVATLIGLKYMPNCNHHYFL